MSIFMGEDRMRKITKYCGGLLAAALITASANAGVSFSFTQGTLSARATFEKVGGNLRITLENIAAGTVEKQENMLTGVFFNLAGVTFDAGNLTNTVAPSAAALAHGDGPIVNPDMADLDDGDGLDGNGEIGGEWAYEDFQVGVHVPGANFAVGSVGMDFLLGNDDLLFRGPALDAPDDSPDGINYAITPLGGLGPNPKGNAGKNPLSRGGVVITLFTSDSWNESDIGNVSFNYGTGLNPIPAPGAVLLGMLGLSMVGRLRRRLG